MGDVDRSQLSDRCRDRAVAKEEKTLLTRNAKSNTHNTEERKQNTNATSDEIKVVRNRSLKFPTDGIAILFGCLGESDTKEGDNLKDTIRFFGWRHVTGDRMTKVVRSKYLSSIDG